MRLIDADAVIEVLNEQIEQCNKALGSFDISLKDEYAVKVERASLEAYKEQLENIPSAQPETNCSEIPNNWIPCSERQPDVNGWYITTISGEICGQDRAFSGMSEFANGKWTSGDDADETEMTIAWCPLPEPYQGGEQG